MNNWLRAYQVSFGMTELEVWAETVPSRSVTHLKQNVSKYYTARIASHQTAVKNPRRVVFFVSAISFSRWYDIRIGISCCSFIPKRWLFPWMGIL